MNPRVFPQHDDKYLIILAARVKLTINETIAQYLFTYDHYILKDTVIMLPLGCKAEPFLMNES